jgi:hypothetical protein
MVLREVMHDNLNRKKENLQEWGYK